MSFLLLFPLLIPPLPISFPLFSTLHFFFVFFVSYLTHSIFLCLLTSPISYPAFSSHHLSFLHSPLLANISPLLLPASCFSLFSPHCSFSCFFFLFISSLLPLPSSFLLYNLLLPACTSPTDGPPLVHLSLCRSSGRIGNRPLLVRKRSRLGPAVWITDLLIYTTRGWSERLNLKSSYLYVVFHELIMKAKFSFYTLCFKRRGSIILRYRGS